MDAGLEGVAVVSFVALVLLVSYLRWGTRIREALLCVPTARLSWAFSRPLRLVDECVLEPVVEVARSGASRECVPKRSLGTRGIPARLRGLELPFVS